MTTGVVVKTLDSKGYGFVRPLGSSDKMDDLFAHFKSVKPHKTLCEQEHYLMVGEQVTFDLVPGQPKPKATNLTVHSHREHVRAEIVGVSSSHIRVRFPWKGKGSVIASVNKQEIDGSLGAAFTLKPHDEITGIAYDTASGQIKIGRCRISSS